MSVKRQIASILGVAVFLVEVVVLVAIALLNAFGNSDALLKIIPPRFLTPLAMLMYMLTAAILLRYGSTEAPPLNGVIYRENVQHRSRITELEAQVGGLETRSQARRLSDGQIQTIARIAKKGLDDLHQTLIAANWPPEDYNRPLNIQILAIENERETLMYRSDFEKAFQDGGFVVVQGELTGVAATQENERFVGAITLLHSKPTNIVRPFVWEALCAAGIEPREASNLPDHAIRYDHTGQPQQLAAVLIVGQRG